MPNWNHLCQLGCDNLAIFVDFFVRFGFNLVITFNFIGNFDLVLHFRLNFLRDEIKLTSLWRWGMPTNSPIEITVIITVATSAKHIEVVFDKGILVGRTEWTERLTLRINKMKQ